LLQRALATTSTVGGDEESQFTEYFHDDNEEALTLAALPSRDDDDTLVVDIEAEGALDMIQSTIDGHRQATLADDLSSVGSLSQWTPSAARRTPVSVVRPIAEYEESLHSIPKVVCSPSGSFSIDTGYGNRNVSSKSRYRQYRGNSTITTSPYEKKNPTQGFGKYKEMTDNHRTRPSLTVVTDVDDESREDLAEDRCGGTAMNSTQNQRDSKNVSKRQCRDGEDEPSRTLEELIGLLEKGYRIKLHNFKGRERAFLFLRDDRKTICIRKNIKTLKESEADIVLDTSIDRIENLEFGRRSESGFHLSPLTSFSIGVADQECDSGIRFYDVEAASPVQREVLVSTLMIMMDAYGTKGEVGQSNPDFTDAPNDIYDNQLREVTEESTGTFDQPIVCSPSLEAIPCSPSLEIGANGIGFEAEEDGNTEDNEVVHAYDEQEANTKHRAFFGSFGCRKEMYMDTRGFEDEDDLIERVSSGEITDQASNRFSGNASGVPVVTVADDLVIETLLSDQDFSGEEISTSNETEMPERDQKSPRGQEIRVKTIQSSPSVSYGLPGAIDEESYNPKLEHYFFKDDESQLMSAGSAAMPIVIEVEDFEPISSLKSKMNTLSFSFSDQSFDVDCGDSVQGVVNSVRKRRLTGRGSAPPSYPTRISEVEELHEVSRLPRRTSTGGHSYEEPDMGQDSQFSSLYNGNIDESNRLRGAPGTSKDENSAFANIKPGLEVPTPHSLQIRGSNSQLTGGWCSDDICTGTLNDMAKTCTGIFAAQGVQQMVSQGGCIDTGFTSEQSAMVEEYIASALGAPTAVYSYFLDGKRQTLDLLSTLPSEPISKDATETTADERGAQKFRNRAARSNAQADRIRSLKNEMTFAHALKQSKERSFIRTTQSFDDAKFLPKLADSAAQKLHSSPLLDSLVTNMMSHWANEGTTGSSAKEMSQEDESVYYDSDPEDSRPRTLHHGPRKIQTLIPEDPDSQEISRPKVLDGSGIDRMNAKLGKRADEDSVKEIVQSMMNERLLVMWHPTQCKKSPNRAPILARLWIESGVYLIDGSFLLPKLSWVKAFGQQAKGTIGTNGNINKLDLLEICRIRACDQVDRSLHPFANGRLSWFIETQQDIFLFESETVEERDRIVYGLKLVVARLASLLMLRDIRAADEFFGAVSNGVPGEAPVWKVGCNDDEEGDEDASAERRREN